MTQYLFSVHMVDGEPVPSDDEIQKAYRQVDELNDELRTPGAWVSPAGCTRRPARPSCAPRTVTC